MIISSKSLFLSSGKQFVKPENEIKNCVFVELTTFLYLLQSNGFITKNIVPWITKI